MAEEEEVEEEDDAIICLSARKSCCSEETEAGLKLRVGNWFESNINQSF